MNKYEVISVVGEGAYGIVLKCKNRVSYFGLLSTHNGGFLRAAIAQFSIS